MTLSKSPCIIKSLAQKKVLLCTGMASSKDKPLGSMVSHLFNNVQSLLESLSPTRSKQTYTVHLGITLTIVPNMPEDSLVQ